MSGDVNCVAAIAGVDVGAVIDGNSLDGKYVASIAHTNVEIVRNNEFRWIACAQGEMVCAAAQIDIEITRHAGDGPAAKAVDFCAVDARDIETAWHHFAVLDGLENGDFVAVGIAGKLQGTV